MTARDDVLSGLPEFAFKGVEYPVLRCDHGFEQQHRRHKIAFRDGEFVEMTGKLNFVLNYTLPMRQGIAYGAYKDLFLEGLPQLFRDASDRKPGPLIDPVYGEIEAVAVSWSDNVDPNKRDGLDVDVSFVQWLDIASEDIDGEVPTIAGLTSDAGALDANIEAVFVEAQVPSPEPSTSILNALAGAGAQLTRARDQTTATLAKFSNQMEKLERQIDAVSEGPINADLKRETRRLRLSAERLQEKAEPTRIVRKSVTTTNKTLAAVALSVGMSVEDLLGLNPRLARSPLVPSGTDVLFYSE
jgi:hypothetical protein